MNSGKESAGGILKIKRNFPPVEMKMEVFRGARDTHMGLMIIDYNEESQLIYLEEEEAMALAKYIHDFYEKFPGW